VDFRLVMFRPFVGEVLIAKLKTCDKSGLYCMFPFPISVMINAAFPMIIRVVPFLFKGFCMDVASVFYSFRTSQHSQNWVFLKTGGKHPTNLQTLANSVLQICVSMAFHPCCLCFLLSDWDFETGWCSVFGQLFWWHSYSRAFAAATFNIVTLSHQACVLVGHLVVRVVAKGQWV